MEYKKVGKLHCSNPEATPRLSLQFSVKLLYMERGIIYSSVSRNDVSIYDADPGIRNYNSNNPPYIDSFLAFLKEKYAASQLAGQVF